MSTTPDHFPTEVAGLPVARTPELVALSDGDQFDLRIAAVAKQLGDATVRMLAYNGSIPGPTLKVPEGSEVVVNVENQGDMEATVHWHGLRLENRYDGTHETQQPIGRRRAASPPASRSPIPACTGTTRTSARTTARRWASTATCSSSPPTPTTGHQPTARSFSPSTTSCCRTARSHRSAAPRRPTPRWAASATCCSSAGSRTSR